MVIVRHIIVLICLLPLVFIATSSPPDEPIKCKPNNTNCTLTNSYGMFPDRSICEVTIVAYPTTEDELIAIVANATKENRKMKAATRYSHSIPKLACPDGPNGLLIGTKYLNRTLEWDAQSLTITVESGMTLKQFISDAAKVGLALPYVPYWWGVTIGGLLGTGAHGSSLWGIGSSVHDYLVSVTIVSPGTPQDGYVKVRTVNQSNPSEFDAVKLSLGVLGVISKVTFKMQPLFKRSITYVEKNDSDLGDKVTSFGHEHEFADLSWFPSQRKAIYRIDDRVSSSESGNGLYDYIPFRSASTLELALVRTIEENQEATRDASGKCTFGQLIKSLLMISAFGLTNNGVIFTGYPVVAYQNRVESSGTCLDSLEDALITACPWDPRIKGEFFHQTTVSIGLSVVKHFIEEVQNLIRLKPESLCVVEQYNGILMRYVKASSAYLGKQEDALDFDITYYRSKDPNTPRLFEDILEEIEQMALFKYSGSPHWGKNRNIAFDGVIKKYKNAKQFLKVKDRYDPLGLFSNEWTDQILGLKGEVSIVKEGCALEGLCICLEDIHCAPRKGYYCRPGKIYKDARVCTLLPSSNM